MKINVTVLILFSYDNETHLWIHICMHQKSKLAFLIKITNVVQYHIL